MNNLCCIKVVGVRLCFVLKRLRITVVQFNDVTSVPVDRNKEQAWSAYHIDARQEAFRPQSNYMPLLNWEDRYCKRCCCHRRVSSPILIRSSTISSLGAASRIADNRGTQSSESDCIIVEEAPEVIVIEDEDEDRPNSSGRTSQCNAHAAQSTEKAKSSKPTNRNSGSANNSEPLSPQQLRNQQDQPQDHPDSFFNRLTQPFKRIRDNLIFPYALRSVASTVSKPAISKDVQALTSTERKRHSIYSSNTFNPNREKRLPGKRMIIIDGSNVAYAHSCNKYFSVKGIEIALQYFNKMGHEAKAVVPQHRLRQSASSDSELLASLHRQGKIVLTPCKNLQGKSTVSYDDRFILQLAVEFDAAVVSNDNFNDLVMEHPAFRKVIESRVVGYTWCKDVFMLPKDPYGRNGPSLSVILNRI